MKDSNKFISPISIDLGAKNTGVYFAHYKVNSNIDFSFFQERSKENIFISFLLMGRQSFG